MFILYMLIGAIIIIAIITTLIIYYYYKALRKTLQKIINYLTATKKYVCDDCIAEMCEFGRNITRRKYIVQDLCNWKPKYFEKHLDKPCELCGKIRITRRIPRTASNVFSRAEKMSKKENETLKNAIAIKTTPNFWIYENWLGTEDKSVIHRAGCPLCNNGKGSNETTQGLWVGPFSTLQEAKVGATKLNRKENLLCNVCNPSQDSN